jgi:hypothetical protein
MEADSFHQGLSLRDGQTSEVIICFIPSASEGTLLYREAFGFPMLGIVSQKLVLPGEAWR